MPITNLQEVKTWLSSLTPGGSVDVSSSLFDATMIGQIFTLLPNSDPISLADISVDADAATLAGVTTLLGESNTQTQFAFAQPDQTLLCTVTITPPGTLSWSLLPDFKVAFTDLKGTLVPDAELEVLGLSFSSTVLAGAATPVRIPVNFTVPSFDGDWTLAGSFETIGSLNTDALQAVAGNNNLLSILPADLAELSKFNLTSFEVAFNPSKKTCTLIGVGIRYDADWKFFNDRFRVQSIRFDFQILSPFTPQVNFTASLAATMQIPGLPSFDVGGQFPDQSVFVQLTPGQTLNVNNVFQFFSLPLPEGFPAVDITTLSFNFYVPQQQFAFELLIDNPIPIYGSISLDRFYFGIDASFDSASGKNSATGTLESKFTIGSTALSISGTYIQDSGLVLAGTASNVPLGAILADLAAKFGVPASDIPEPIRNIQLENVTIDIDTGKKAFNFSLKATTEMAGVTVGFSPAVKLTYNSSTKSFDFAFTGSLVLNLSPERTVTFTLAFSKTGSDKYITAAYDQSGGALQFEDIAAFFHFGLPAIPSNLDLSLTNAAIYYDFGTGNFALGAKSKNYGNAAFATLPINKKREYFFLLNSGQSFSLSNLPLVGEQLAKLENIEVSDLNVVISSFAPVSGTDARAVNTLIGKLKNGYPQLPDQGIPGKFQLTAKMNFGTAVFPINVSLGTPAKEQAQLQALLPTSSALVPAAQPAASENPDGTTWFTIQKSFGPVSIQRIGVLYQAATQTLWFQIDATLAFGPLTLDLTGLGIGSPLTSFKPSFFLQGLGLAYNNPPLTVAGALINLAPPGADYIEFEGGLIVGTGSFQVQVFGYYGTKSGFTSLFIYGGLSYPFGGPPAFFVTGVALGFGYNSNLRLPTITEVHSFPFVQVLPTSTTPKPDIFGKNPTPTAVLQVITGSKPPWVAPVKDNLWFAAGITFTSFSLVNSQALLIVLISSGGDPNSPNAPGLVISLIGTSRAVFPQRVPGVPNAPIYANIELNLLVVFAPQQGRFSLEAQLAASSFLLDKACVLTGGFAFFVWFGPNPNAGDFVLSLGGYNSGFKPPAHYPVVPRVGFHWSLDSSISISGGTYFAFTPAAMMVGGALNATYRSGNLKAWFDAHADVIVRWKPFWFEASIGISIGASYKVNLLLTSFTVSIELGCDLELWGPPTGGSVRVKWVVISFTIRFGSSKTSGQQIKSWTDVQEMLPNTGSNKKDNILNLTPSAGILPGGTAPGPATPTVAGFQPATRLPRPEQDPPSADPQPPWLIRAGEFAFNTASPIPATTATVGATYRFQGDTFNVYPLKWKNVTATHAVTIKDSAGNDISSSFEASQVRNNVPASLWGSPPEDAKGRPQVPAANKLTVPNQTVGVFVQVKPPSTGNTAGPIDVAANLAYNNLNLPDAVVPISSSAQPKGDIPVNSKVTIATIADPHTGIASANITSVRNAIFSALQAVRYAPDTSNDPMSKFASQVGCAFATDPLLVP
ncbi:MAG TPA: DUF6603 domain-containing protein [Bryobacteraceae bacterium]|jgi:hypothetical protein|nr:DUF6603 domain-containing protein [Bryobacteraceae bacterium]